MTVDLVLFEIAGARYGADLAQVRRIDHDELADQESYPLGVPTVGRRALVYQPADGVERRLAVDTILGVRPVSISDLRRLPRTAAAPPMSIGAWLDGDLPVLLIDLHALHPLTQSTEHPHDHGQ